MRQITSGDADDTYPNWSPVANEVEFVRDWLPNGDLYRVNIDSGAESRVTSTPERIEGDAAWAPSGDRIVFTGCYTGLGCQIFTINPDGSGEKQLTVAGGYSYSPNWQALPTQTVGVQKLGTGSGIVRDATGRLDCGDSCSASFARGDHVQLEAVPAPDSTFRGWSTAVCSNTSLSCSLTVEADTTVTAVFVKKQAILTVRKAGSGTATSRPPASRAGGDAAPRSCPARSR